MNRDYWQLRTASRNYYDAYRLTVRIGNRLAALAREGESYTPSTEPLLYEQLVNVKAMKEASGKLLVRLYKQTAPPLVVKFQQETLGLGEVWVARLVGEVGDFRTYTEAWWTTPDEAGLDDDRSQGSPASHDDDDDDELSPGGLVIPKRVLAIGEVRTTGVRELWAYCGHGDASLKRRRGQSQDEALASGNPTAKMIVHQMAEFALRLNGNPDKNGKPRGQTPYYPAYLAARQNAETLHPDWRKGHVYNHAIRLTGKAILKDLWRVQHGEEPVYGARTEWAPRRAA